MQPWTERQLPEGDAVFLDHVGLFVRSLAEARLVLSHLGFLLSDENVHMNQGPDGTLVPAGTVNKLITPGLGYIELLEARTDSPLSDQLRAALARYQGLHLLALSHADVFAQEDRLRGEGFAAQPAVNLRRDVEVDGATRQAAFDVLRVRPEDMPEGRVQWCGHKTPELVWRDGMTEHPNGAEAVTGALFVVDDVEEAVERYAAFTGKPGIVDRGVGMIALDRGVLTFIDQVAADDWLPGTDVPSRPYGAAIGVRVANIARTKAHFATIGVTMVDEQPDGVFVSGVDACGVGIFFHSRDAETPWVGRR